MYVPSEEDIYNSDDPETVRLYNSMVRMVKNIRRNESEGIVLPDTFKLELLSSGGSRQFDTNAVIQRYDTAIVQTVMADFIMLGHEGVGSYALSSDKTSLFTTAISAYLDIICETFNSQGIPRLIDLNGGRFSGITDYPQLTHGDAGDRDIEKLSTFVKDLVNSGVILPDEQLEDYLRAEARLPERTEDLDMRTPDPLREEARRRPEGPQEAAERAAELRTQGRKGCKAVRINMAFTPDNHEFIRVMAKITGKTMTEFANLVIERYRTEHPELYDQAKAIIDQL